MSQENVEVVRRGIDAWNRRNVGDFMGFVGADTEVVPVIDPGPLHGQEAIRRWLRDNFATMPEFRAEARELRDLGDTVLVLGVVHTRGQSSGIELDSPFGFVATFQEGRLARLQMFVDHTAALKAVGLKE